MWPSGRQSWRGSRDAPRPRLSAQNPGKTTLRLDASRAALAGVTVVVGLAVGYRIGYFLLPYRSFADPFLIVSAVAVPLWLIFRLYRLRTSGHPLSRERELLLLIFVLYLCALAAATLTPNHPSRRNAEAMPAIELRPDLGRLTCSSASLPRGSNVRSFCKQNVVGNIALFFPLGILLPLVWRRLRFWRGLLIAIAVSVSIELLQYLSRGLGSYRLADVNDILLNSLGAGLGLLLVSLYRLLR